MLVFEMNIISMLELKLFYLKDYYENNNLYLYRIYLVENCLKVWLKYKIIINLLLAFLKD